MLKPERMFRGLGVLWVGLMVSACATSTTPPSRPVLENPASSRLPTSDQAVAWAMRHRLSTDPDVTAAALWLDTEWSAKAQIMWAQAVADRQAQAIWRTHREAAALTLELAQRSQVAGHLSTFDLARVRLQVLEVAEQWRQAQTQAALSALKLQEAMGLPPSGATWDLPDALPAQAQLSELARLWDRVNERSPRAQQAAALELKAAYATAQSAVSERMPLARQRLDEALLRYNGMLISVFDLLAVRQELAQAELQALQAKHRLMVLTYELQAQLPVRS